MCRWRHLRRESHAAFITVKDDAMIQPMHDFPRVLLWFGLVWFFLVWFGLVWSVMREPANDESHANQKQLEFVAFAMHAVHILLQLALRHRIFLTQPMA